MNLNEYQKTIQEFRLPSADSMYVLLGLVGEVGELYGYFAKAIRDDFTPDWDHVAKEIGDVLWFVACLAEDSELDLNAIAIKNIAKLSSRKERGTIQGSGDNR